MNGLIKSFVFLSALTALFMGLGYVLAGQSGMIIAFFLAFVMNIIAWWQSDKLILRLYKAKPLTSQNAPDLYDITALLANKADMPMPKLYIINNPQPNAFATGRSPEKGAVALTTGLLDHLTLNESAGVIAHELAHIKNRDSLIMTLTATLAGAISMVANFALFFGNRRDAPLGIFGILLISILAPLAASLVQMAISRTREYEADRIGAEICGRPLWLANALAKISDQTKRIDNAIAENNPATAHLFIMNPLHVHKIDGLFSTHPPTAERIRRLKEMA